MGSTPMVIDRGRGNLTRYAAGLIAAAQLYKQRAAQRGVEIAQGYFDQGGPPQAPWAPLHEVTRDMKPGAKILVDMGSLRDSITVFSTGSEIAFGSTHPLAAVHEFGVTVRVTEPMRGYLHSLGFHLNPDTSFLVIPARPFLTPAAQQLADEMIDIFEQVASPLTRVRVVV